MRLGMKLIFAAVIALILMPARVSFAADDLEKTLRKLDAAAANFHSTSADFKFDDIDTDPVYDDDVQTGVVYYQRTGGAFQMGVHIDKHNNKPAPKIYTYGSGVFELFEPPPINQLTTFTKAGKFESYVMLGFGASGKDLEQKWGIKYLGPETIDGVKTAKLELIPKDPTVKKNIPKVTVWIDTARAVSLKQVFDQGPGQFRVSVYFNIKTNQTLPADAFTFQTDSKTQYVNR